MIRRLIILLLIVGCVFGDTIIYKSGSKNRTIENVEYIKAGNGKVYFKAHGREVSRDCSQVVTFTDNVGNPIEYDCSVVIDEPTKDKPILSMMNKSKSYNHLVDSGERLINFKKKYYRGFIIAAFGQLITLLSYTSNEPQQNAIIIGNGIGLLGGLMTFSSFNDIGNAGEDLIDAGKSLEEEKEQN